jgi:hypothetical protein
MTEKTALIERLVRLGATDVPGTDRWVMRHRSPAELAQLQHGVEAGIGKLQAPFKAGLEKVVSPLPGKLQGAARAVGNAAIDNPEVALPGGSLAVIGKKALEKVIDRVAPLAKTGFAVSQYSGPLNPDIRSGASGLPPFRAPRLGAAVQKTAFATTYSAGPSPDWAHDTAPPSGASSLPPRRAPRLDVAVQKTAAAELEFFLLKVSTDANMGQWWEQKGGPHLAKGGSHKEFRKMMDKEKFPDHVKKKFMDVAAKKYPQGHNEPGGGQRHWSSWSAPRAAKPSGIMGHIARHPVAAGMAASAGIVGAGYLADRIGDHLEKRKKEHEPKQKAAAGAPTRGNFMMASDIPSYRPPRLDRAIQKAGELETEPRVDIFKGAAPKKEEPKKVKAGDMLPDYVTYSPNDFKRSKYAMPTEKLAEYVEGLLKEASSDEPGPNGEPPMSHEEFMKAFRSPGEVAALKRKERLGLGVLGSTAALGTAALAARHFMKKTAIPGLTPQSRLEQSSGIGAPRAAAPAVPGPSIADQAKPKGPGFGTGIAGANKGTIGGTNVGGIGNMAAVPQL